MGFLTSLAFAQVPVPIAAFHFSGDFYESVSGVEADTSSLYYNEVDGPRGSPNKAVQITGGSVVFPAANFAAMDTSDHSIAFWFRRDGSSLWPAKTVFTGPGYSYRYNGVFHQVEFRFKPHPDSAEIITTVRPSDNVWEHIVISIDRDDSMRYYMNGILRFKKDVSNYQNINVSSANPRISMGRNDVSLDEVLFFDWALSAQEVIALQNANLTSIEQHVSDAWKMYPNPSSGLIRFEGLSGENASYRVLDLQGKVLLSSSLRNNAADLSVIPLGNYIVHIQQRGESRSFPLILQ